MMAAAITAARGLSCTFVFTEEHRVRQNRLRDKLQDRGIRIEREYRASSMPPKAGDSAPRASS